MDITRVAAVSPVTQVRKVNSFNLKKTRTQDKRREEEDKKNSFEQTLKLKSNSRFDTKA